MKKETFFHSFSSIAQNARKIEEAYQKKHREAADQRLAIYTEAIEHVKAQPSWPQLTPEQQQEAIAPLE